MKDNGLTQVKKKNTLLNEKNWEDFNKIKGIN